MFEIRYHLLHCPRINTKFFTILALPSQKNGPRVRRIYWQKREKHPQVSFADKRLQVSFIDYWKWVENMMRIVLSFWDLKLLPLSNSFSAIRHFTFKQQFNGMLSSNAILSPRVFDNTRKNPILLHVTYISIHEVVLKSYFMGQ